MSAQILKVIPLSFIVCRFVHQKLRLVPGIPQARNWCRRTMGLVCRRRRASTRHAHPHRTPGPFTLIRGAEMTFLISMGIIAFGIWIVDGTPLAWAFMGLLSVIVGSISLYQATRDFRIA